jgi:hypothetical protein
VILSTAKKMLRRIAEIPTPTVSKDTYDSFFRNPCWLALQLEATRLMDTAIDRAFSSDDIKEIYESRGMVRGLLLMVETKEVLSQIISDNENETNESTVRLRNLEAALELLSNEIKE